MIRPPPRSTLFPYPPLSRSPAAREGGDGFRGGGRDPDSGETAARLQRLHQIVRALKPFVGGLRHHLFDDLERGARSEEHTSELQSRLHLVCRLLLEKKKRRQLHDFCP